MRVIWSEPALADLAEIRQYIEQDNPEAARRVIRRIKAAVRQLRRFPQLGRAAPEPGVRVFIIPGTPYLVPYTLQRNHVAIVRVLHGARRRPGE